MNDAIAVIVFKHIFKTVKRKNCQTVILLEDFNLNYLKDEISRNFQP